MKFFAKQTIKRACLLVGLLLFPLTAHAAAVYTATVPESARAGDEIRILITPPTGTVLTTLGLSLEYDANVLSYVRDEWHTDANEQLKLVSDVANGGGRMLNISFIDGNGYTANGALVSLVFQVKQDYAENPVNLVFRDATDKNEQAISGQTETVFSDTADNGQTDGSITENTQTDEAANETGGSTEKTTDATNNSGLQHHNENANGYSPASATGNVTGGQNGYDRTYKTGSRIEPRELLIGTAILTSVLLLGAIGYGIVLKKRETSLLKQYYTD